MKYTSSAPIASTGSDLLPEKLQINNEPKKEAVKIHYFHY
jgi:hypothetical protein